MPSARPLSDRVPFGVIPGSGGDGRDVKGRHDANASATQSTRDLCRFGNWSWGVTNSPEAGHRHSERATYSPIPEHKLGQMCVLGFNATLTFAARQHRQQMR